MRPHRDARRTNVRGSPHAHARAAAEGRTPNCSHSHDTPSHGNHLQRVHCLTNCISFSLVRILYKLKDSLGRARACLYQKNIKRPIANSTFLGVYHITKSYVFIVYQVNDSSTLYSLCLTGYFRTAANHKPVF